MIDATTLACSTCRVTMVEGGGNAASWSIFTLFVVITLVLAIVSYAIFRMMRRSESMLDPELKDDYVFPNSDF